MLMVIRLDPDAAGPNITFVEVLLIIELKRRARRLSSLEAAAFWSERAVHTIHNVYFCTSVYLLLDSGLYLARAAAGRRMRSSSQKLSKSLLLSSSLGGLSPPFM